MEPPFKRYLADIYKSYFHQQSMSFLKRYYPDELLFENQDKKAYRTPAEMARLEADVSGLCEIISKELVDELEAAGIVSPQSFSSNLGLTEAAQEKYLQKLEKFLRELQ